MDTVIRNLDERGVLQLTMNRPKVHNAFDDQLIADLTQILCDAERDPAVRILVLTGAGPSFSAGADIGWMQRMVDASESDNQQDALRLGRLLRTLNYFPHPTIAMINGAALGGGSGLAACCDIAVACDEAIFGFTETRLGLVPAMISPYVLDAIGSRNARRYFLTGERFAAKIARDIGLIHQICDGGRLDECVELMVHKLLRSGPRAVNEAKRLIRHVDGRDREQQKALDRHTAKLIAHVRVSEEGQQGLKAFLERRRAPWIDQG